MLRPRSQFRAGGGFCNLVTRNPAASQQLTVSNAHTNIATQLAEGIDYTIRYDRELGPGSFRMNAQATHYLTQANKLFEDDQLDEAQFAAWVQQASQLPGERM